MQRHASTAKNLCRKIIYHRNQTQLRPNTNSKRPCDVFISHRGIDTRRTISGLLHDHLTRLRLNSFLDNKNMNPGDRLFDKIDAAIKHSKVGVAVFSPRYCQSYFCLHELALLVESRKRLIPIFYDVKPSKLRVEVDGTCAAAELQRFSWALEEAKFTVGLTFDSLDGDWSEFLTTATDAVMKNLIQVSDEESIANSQTNLAFLQNY